MEGSRVPSIVVEADDDIIRPERDSSSKMSNSHLMAGGKARLWWEEASPPGVKMVRKKSSK